MYKPILVSTWGRCGERAWKKRRSDGGSYRQPHLVYIRNDSSNRIGITCTTTQHTHTHCRVGCMVSAQPQYTYEHSTRATQQDGRFYVSVYFSVRSARPNSPSIRSASPSSPRTIAKFTVTLATCVVHRGEVKKGDISGENE